MRRSREHLTYFDLQLHVLFCFFPFASVFFALYLCTYAGFIIDICALTSTST